MNEKMKWLEKYAPLGIELGKEINLYIAEVVIATLQSSLFFIRYLWALGDLYMYRGSKKVLIEGAVMQSFDSLTDNVFSFGIIVCVATLMMAFVHYAYHYQGSKMMYLMKRLPNKWDVHRRVWTLPIVGCVLMALWMLVLRMIFFAVYILCTPSQCL